MFNNGKVYFSGLSGEPWDKITFHISVHTYQWDELSDKDYPGAINLAEEFIKTNGPFNIMKKGLLSDLVEKFALVWKKNYPNTISQKMNCFY